MTRHGKRYRAALEKVDRAQLYPLAEAISLVKQLASAKFDESVDLAVRLGLDSTQSEQTIRGTTVLPHGFGKEVRVVVFAKGEKGEEAKEAGADEVGVEELFKKIEGGWLDFDTAIATPDLMGRIGRLGKILGPRGLMPNPKLGTVTFDVAKAVREAKAGKVEFRTEKGGIVHASIGKVSFSEEQLAENAKTLVQAVQRLKPPSAKGLFLRSMTLSSTMGPGIRVDTSLFM